MAAVDRDDSSTHDRTRRLSRKEKTKEEVPARLVSERRASNGGYTAASGRWAQQATKEEEVQHTHAIKGAAANDAHDTGGGCGGSFAWSDELPGLFSSCGRVGFIIFIIIAMNIMNLRAREIKGVSKRSIKRRGKRSEGSHSARE